MKGVPQRGDGGREAKGPEEITEVPQVIEEPGEEFAPTLPPFIPPITLSPTIPPFIQPGTPPPTVKPPPSVPSCVLPMVPAVDVSGPTRSYKYGKWFTLNTL